MFNKANITVQWYTCQHPTYKQMVGGFQPNMSIIDLLFNAGSEDKEIILKAAQQTTLNHPT